MPMSDFVSVASFSDIQEATIVKGMLESNGIPVLIQDRNNLYVPVFGGISLLVDRSALPRAVELLKSHND